MGHYIAKLFSYIFHPLFMPTISMFVIFQLDTYMTYTVHEGMQRFLYIWVFISTAVFPLIMAFFMLNRGMIKTIHMDTKEERVVPFAFTALFYFGTYYLMLRLNLPQPILSMMLGASISVLIALIVTLRWKISIHMIGMGGLLGAMYGVGRTLDANILILFIPLIVAAGFLGFARLRLNAHNPWQVYAGWITGFVSVSATILFGIG